MSVTGVAAGWGYVAVYAQMGEEVGRERWLDLSLGSEERAFAVAVLERGEARFRFRAGEEIVHRLGDDVREQVRVALEGTRDVSAEEWRRELAAADHTNAWAVPGVPECFPPARGRRAPRAASVLLAAFGRGARR